MQQEGNEKTFKLRSFFHSWIRQNAVLLFLTGFIVLIFFVFITPHYHLPGKRASIAADKKIKNLEGNPIFPSEKKINTQNQKPLGRNYNIPWEGCETSLPYPDTRKHIVPPPKGPVTIVCCNTTKGPMSIEVHPAWAPIGAERFLYMVKDGFFSTNVPLFRALRGFLVQFGIAGDPSVHKRYIKMGHLQDDKQWLPLGPTGREINGTKRFQKGYMAYAGAGKNSRDTQMFMTFKDNLYLGGGSPWEVPFAQVFGERALQTLSKIYTGYGEKPSQGKIMNRGAKYIQEEFPLVDFINACVIVKENITIDSDHNI